MGWRGIGCTGCAVVATFSLGIAVVTGIGLTVSGPLAQAQAASSGVEPMPSLDDARFASITGAAARACAGGPGAADCQLHVLAMAWVDSRWGQGGGELLSTDHGAQLAVDVARSAGFASDSLVTAVAIAGAESHWNASAENVNHDRTGMATSTDYGMWQINSSHLGEGPGQWALDRILDPAYNAEAAFAISSHGSNWTPWCTYWSDGLCGSQGGQAGAAPAPYLQYTAEARQAITSAVTSSQYTGIVELPIDEWAFLGRRFLGTAPVDPSNPAQAFPVAAGLWGSLSGTDDRSRLMSFYSQGAVGIDQALLAGHVDAVMRVLALAGSGLPTGVPLDPGTFVVSQGFGCSAVDREPPPPAGIVCPAGFPRWHSGVDLAVPLGTVVHAPADGVVREITAEQSAGYGDLIELQIASDSGRTVFFLAHLSQFLVADGARVQARDAVGLSGSTGNSSGPHLHVEVRVDGRAVNPCSSFPAGYLPEPVPSDGCLEDRLTAH